MCVFAFDLQFLLLLLLLQFLSPSPVMNGLADSAAASAAAEVALSSVIGGK